jgi:hypothetical protein
VSVTWCHFYVSAWLTIHQDPPAPSHRTACAPPLYQCAGFQAQTAECLVLGEIAAHGLVVALNKVDLLPPDERARGVRRATKLISKTLAATKFAGADVIPVATRPGALTQLTLLLTELALLLTQLAAWLTLPASTPAF